MPVYPFKCPGCGECLERRIPVDDRDVPIPCPSCGATLRRQFCLYLINMNGATSGDPITEWQFKHLDEVSPREI